MDPLRILLIYPFIADNIKIRFYELDEYDQEVWQDYGVFSEADVHHQYAIAFKTPAYHNKDITEPVEVLMQLYRPKDKCQSEPVPFKYKPRLNISRKRPRVCSGQISSEIPTVVPNEPGNSRLPPFNHPFPIMSPMPAPIPESNNTISKEYNKSAIIQDILESHIPTTIASDISFSSNDFKDFVGCNSEGNECNQFASLDSVTNQLAIFISTSQNYTSSSPRSVRRRR